MRLILLTAVLAVSLVACGDNGETVESTTTSTVGATTTSTTLAVTTTTGMTLSSLTGNWANDDLVLEVNDGGEFVLRLPSDPTGALMGGFVARDGDELSFVTSTTGECPGQTGVYGVVASEDSLTLTLVDDPCPVRVSGFESSLTRTD